MLLTTHEAALITERHFDTIHDWLHAGKLKTARKIGRDWLIEAGEIMEIREKLQKKQTPRHKSAHLL